MGNRYYFGKISKEDHDKIRDLDLRELKKYARLDFNTRLSEGYMDFVDFVYPNVANIFGLLREEAIEIQKLGTDAFMNKSVQLELLENTPFLVGKDGLLKVIEIYKNQIIDHNKEMLDLPMDSPEFRDRARFYFEMIGNDWRSKNTLDLTTDSTLTKSGRYEYAVFNLVSLLKTINWDKESLIFHQY